jgi:dTMP kinase
MPRGLFITVEGPDGAGKSTVANALKERLQGEVVVTREPGDGPIGPAIRQILLEGQQLDGWTEVFLFLADRRQHCEHVIKPALERGATVICDRFADSTVVYQGYARGLDIGMLKRLNALATGGLKPNLTLLLDLPVETAMARMGSRDRLDAEPEPFHRAVRSGFLAEARLEPARWKVLDASALPEDLARNALASVLRLR